MRNKTLKKKGMMLKLLSEYTPISTIANLLNIKPCAVYTAFWRYRKKGLINNDRSLTSNGIQTVKKAFAISQTVKYQPNSIRLHNLTFSVLIPRISRWKDRDKFLTLKHIDFQTIDMGTWKTQQIIIDNRKIWLNPKKIIFYMDDYYADTPLEAFSEALNELKTLVSKIEKRFKIRLVFNNSIDFEVGRQHYALIKNQLAKKYNKEKKKLFVYDSENKLRLLIDDSLKLNEFEAVDPKESRIDSTIVQGHFKDIIEKKHYKPSTTKEMIDNTVENLNRLTEQNLSFSNNIGRYNKNIELHLGVLTDMKNTLKLIGREFKQRRIREDNKQKKLNEY